MSYSKTKKFSYHKNDITYYNSITFVKLCKCNNYTNIII